MTIIPSISFRILINKFLTLLINRFIILILIKLNFDFSKVIIKLFIHIIRLYIFRFNKIFPMTELWNLIWCKSPMFFHIINYTFIWIGILKRLIIAQRICLHFLKSNKIVLVFTYFEAWSINFLSISLGSFRLWHFLDLVNQASCSSRLDWFLDVVQTLYKILNIHLFHLLKYISIFFISHN